MKRQRDAAAAAPPTAPGPIRLGIVVLALAAVAMPARADAEETEEIRQVFADYKAALLAGDGDRAVALVDQATLDYWGEIRSLALGASEEEVRARSFIDRLLVVSVRHQLAPELLETMGLGDIIHLAVAESWINPQSIFQLEMGEVTVTGKEASGQALTRTLTTAGDTTAAPVEALEYRFVREGDRWKFRFSSLVANLNGIIAELARQLGTEEDDLIFMLVESFSGRQVLPEVWERPQTEEPEG